MSFDRINHSIEEEEFPETDGASASEDEAAASRKRLYIIIAMFLVTVIVVGAFLTILTSGMYGGWWQRMAMTHDPLTSAPVGQELEIKAKVTGWPENVTLYYLVQPNNATLDNYRDITFKRAYMLLLGERAQDYSYTIPALEVTGDIIYFLVAVDDFGNEIAEPMHEIEVSDFIIKSNTKDMKIYYSTPNQAEITVHSLNNFNSPVTFRISQTFGDYIPSGLAVEFNPKTVTPPKNGVAKSIMTVRALSKDFLPGGDYDMAVEGVYSSPAVTIVRNSTIIEVEVPSFDFTVSPDSQELPRSWFTHEYGSSYSRERYVTYNITIDIEGEFGSDFKFRIVGLPDELDYRLVLPAKTINMSGSIMYSLQLMDQRYLQPGTTIITATDITSQRYRSGTYLLTFFIVGGGFEQWDQVTLEITGYDYESYR